jgi:predicted dehydrogenase
MEKNRNAMKKLRGAIIGTGFWANYQVPAWLELDGVEIVALYNRTKAKAETINEKFSLNAGIYDDINALLSNEEIDFADIITDVDTHAHFTTVIAGNGKNVICQKPMASSIEEASTMLSVCDKNGVKLFIHENFRWQAPLRALKKTLDSGVIGDPFKARVSFCSAFPVFDNQPFLATLEKFILTDIGSHILDICRYLFGEAETLYCLTQKVNPEIKGEDVANVLMKMKNGLHCIAEMSYASLLEKEAFPQTLILVEGQKGSVQLTHNFEIKVTTAGGTSSEIIQPKMYDWLDPDYAVVHSSIVDCNANIFRGLQGLPCETTGEDNYKTIQLVNACYESAAGNKIIQLK